MPLYEYACSCGHTFEELIVRRGDETEVRCPRCGAADVRRAVSRPAASPAASGATAPRCGPVG